MNRKEVLLGAANLIRTKGHTKAAYARDSEGTVVDYASPKAVCYCVSGAIQYFFAEEINPAGQDDAYNTLHRYIADKKGFNSMIHWNDAETTTQEEVIRVLEEAAATCG